MSNLYDVVKTWVDCIADFDDLYFQEGFDADGGHAVVNVFLEGEHSATCKFNVYVWRNEYVFVSSFMHEARLSQVSWAWLQRLQKYISRIYAAEESLRQHCLKYYKDGKNV